MAGVLFGLLLSRTKEISNISRFWRTTFHVGIIDDSMPWLNRAERFPILLCDLQFNDDISMFRKEMLDNCTFRSNDKWKISVFTSTGVPIRSIKVDGLTNQTKWNTQDCYRITTRLFPDILRNYVTQLIDKKRFRTLTFNRDFNLKNSHKTSMFRRRLISSNSTSLRNNNRVLTRTLIRSNCIQIRRKSYARFLDYSRVPKLLDSDLEEQFVRGSGPGGQAVNKTNNAVVLKHKPTGLTVKCHETRSAIQNRQRAREILLTKLDNMLNGENSLENQEKLLKKKNLLKKEQKKKKLADMKKAFKERENLE